MPIDYAQLKTELADASYAGLSDADAAALRNSKTITTVGTALMPLVLIWAAKNGVILSLKAVYDGTASPMPPDALRAPMIAAWLMFNSGMGGLDLSNPDNQAMVAGLVQGGIITSDMSIALTALATTTAIDVIQKYGRMLDFADIQIARAL